MSDEEIDQCSGGVDREEIEQVASELSDISASLSKNTAISDELTRSIQDKSHRLFDALPSEVEVHRSIDTDLERSKEGEDG
jgi:hypothetical protein